MKKISELRQDLVSGDWIIVADNRGKRPHDFVAKEKVKSSSSKENCPFKDLYKAAGGGGPVFMYYRKDGKFSSDKESIGASDDDWFIGVIPNKYPVLASGICKYEEKMGPYNIMDGVGIHDVVVYRDHSKYIADMDIEEVDAILSVFKRRYEMIKEIECVEYVSIIHNHGPLAGASLAHPHSQIFSVPVVPSDVGRSISGSAEYFNKHKKCVHCVMLEWEANEKSRIIYENDSMVVITPFVSRVNFEIRIFPKVHQSRFEFISGKEQRDAADALRIVLKKLKTGFNDPDFNFFIHTSPTNNGGLFSHYHWHIEILPKTSIWAGFELGTGIEIITVAPEKAAEFLGGIKN